ncbi:MAG: hypothetical protein GEU26_12495 [Nitrososphaeraceae archaeon]|nr:hypothetical protein [Nitrososphaeraceae archaeon]
MPHTIVEMYVPATFADEGTYKISLDNRPAHITIQYLPSHGNFAHVTGLDATQNLDPDDPSGIVNFSYIEMDFPYYLEEPGKGLSDDSSERASAYHKKIDDLCLRYLNRLVDVVRYCTQRYWIRSIPLDLLHVHMIKEVEEDSGGRGISWIRMPSGSKVEWKIQSQLEVQERLVHILEHETRLPVSETLFLEALNYYYCSNIVQAVIVANTLLEVFVMDDIIDSYMKQGKSGGEAKILVAKSYKKKFEPMIKNIISKKGQTCHLIQS